MENPRIILGLGTGRCGSRNLHQLFLKQRLLKHNNSIQNKLKYCMHEYKWFPKFQTQTEEVIHTTSVINEYALIIKEDLSLNGELLVS